MGMYDGEIYKTRNLRNQSLMQLFPTDSLMKHAQDSIEQSLDTFGKQLWVLTPEEIEAAREAAAASDTTAVDDADKKASVKEESDNKKKERSSRSSRSSSKKKPKAVKQKQSSGNSAPIRSVRRTK